MKKLFIFIVLVFLFSCNDTQITSEGEVVKSNAIDPSIFMDGECGQYSFRIYRYVDKKYGIIVYSSRHGLTCIKYDGEKNLGIEDLEK
jgi:hypothetical protein